MRNILNAIAQESSKNGKLTLLKQFKDTPHLKDAIYLANSPRIKFYIKQLPKYTPKGIEPLEWCLKGLRELLRQKLRGGEASGFLEVILECMSEDDAYVLERIIDKNLKIGMDTGFDKVFPKLIERTPYQGAKPFSKEAVEKLFLEGSLISQIKADGTYRNAIVRGGEVELVSRQGEVSNLFGAEFLEELSQLDDCVLNGELTILGVERVVANGIINSLMDVLGKAHLRTEQENLKKREGFIKKHGSLEKVLQDLRFTVWDYLTVDEYFNSKSDVSYEKRLYLCTETVKGLKCVDVIESKIVESYEEAVAHFATTQKLGLEGTVLKSLKAGWKDGKFGYQIKFKLEIQLDLKIVGFEFGGKNTKNEKVISTLNVESICGLLKTSPSGMSEALMKQITDNQDFYLGKIVEVKCSGLSQDSLGNYSTQHPSVQEVRVDKIQADSLEDCKNIELMAKQLK
jgi:DNA ligase-1